MPNVAGPSEATRSGSQQALRERNARKVLESLRLRGPQAQAELVRSTGLSNGTVSNIVRDLRERGRVQTEPTVTSGRRSVLVSLRADDRVVVGIDIGRTHLRVLACDTGHRTFGRRETRLETAHRPEETFRLAAALVDELLAEHDVAPERLRLAGIALPASISPGSGAVVQAAVLPNWAERDLFTMSEQILGLPTVVDNDANLGALAHVTFARAVGVQTLIYLKVATGIGAGMTLDGRVYRSTSGVVGELGHTQIMDRGDVCNCGNRGCLETVASTRRVVADVAQISPGRTITLDQVVADARQGDPAVLRILAEAGTSLGRAVAMLCNFVSPDVIVLGGPLADVGGALLEAMVASARRRALPAAVAATAFRLSELGSDAEVLGACALALQHLDAIGSR